MLIVVRLDQTIPTGWGYAADVEELRSKASVLKDKQLIKLFDALPDTITEPRTFLPPNTWLLKI